MAAAMSYAESKRYSWWWDSHISPKNSKWLQDNLTDMDKKVGAMLKLINEDADSFARRAEMFYKKRPELEKMVEEFYRAYRALAERYSQATGALRQAQITITEAFPNQIPSALSDDSPSPSSSFHAFHGAAEPQTPEAPNPILPPFDPDELHTDAPPGAFPFKRNGHGLAHGEETGALSGRKGLKELNDLLSSGEMAARGNISDIRVRKGLRFEIDEAVVHEASDKVASLQKEIDDLKSRFESESERAVKAETQVQSLQGMVSHMSSERDESLQKCTEFADKLSDMQKLYDSSLEDRNKLACDITMAKDAASELKQAKEDAEAALHDLQRRFDSLDEQNRSLELLTKDLQQQLGELKGVEGSLKSSIARLSLEKDEALSHCRNSSESAAKLETELSRVHAALQDEIRERSLVQLVLAEQQSLCHQSQQEVSKLVGEVGELNSKLDASVATIEGLSGKMEVLNQMNGKLQHEVSVHIAEKEALQSKLNSVENTTFELKNRVDSLAEQNLASVSIIKDLRSQIELSTETNGKLEQELGLCLAKEEALLRDLSVLKEQVNALSEENFLSVSTMEDLRSKMVFLKETNSKLEHNVSVGLAEKEALQCKLNAAENMALQLKNQINALSEQNLAAALAAEDLRNEIALLKETNGKLESKVSVHLAEKEDLQRELNVAESMKADLEKSTEELKNQIDALSEQHLSAVSTMEDLNSKIEFLKEMNGELKHKVGIHLAEKEALQRELNAAQNMKADLENSKHELKNQISDLSDQNLEFISIMEDLRNEIALLKEMNGEHEHKVSVHLAEKEVMQRELSAVERTKADLENSTHELKSQINALSEQNLSFGSTMKDLCNKIESSKKMNGELEHKVGIHLAEKEALQCDLNEAQRMKADLENLTHELKHQINALSEQHHRAVSTMEDLRKKIQSMNERNGKLEHNVSVHLDEKKALQRELNVEQSMKADLATLTHELKNQINALSEQHLAAVSTLEDLRNEIESLKEMNGELRHNVGVHLAEKEALQRELTTAGSIKVELESTVHELNNQVSTLTEQNLEFCSTMEDIRNKIALLKEMNGGLEHKFRVHLAEKEALQCDLNAEQSMTADSEKSTVKLKNQVGGQTEQNLAFSLTMEDIRNEIELLKETNGKLDRKFSVHLAEKEALQFELNVAQSMKVDLENSIHELKNQIDAMSEKHLAAVSTIEYLRNEIESLKETNGALDQKVCIHLAEKEDLKRELNLADSVNVELESTTHELKNQVNALAEQNLASASTIEDLRSKIKVLKEMNAYLEQEVGVCIGEKEALQQRLNFVEMTAHELKNQVDALCEQNLASVLMTEDLRNKLELLKEMNGKLEHEKEALQCELNAAQRMNADLENLMHKLENQFNALTEQNLSSVSTIKDLCNKNELLKEMNDKLKHEVSVHLDDKEALRSELNVLESMKADFESSTHELKNQVSALSEQNLAFVSTIEDLQSKIKLLNELNAGFEHEVSLHIGEKVALQRDLNQHRDDRDNLERKHHAATVELEASRKNVDELRIKIDELTSKCDNHVMQHSLLLEMVSSLGQQMKARERELLQRSADVESMQGELQTHVKSLALIEERCTGAQEEQKKLLAELQIADQTVGELMRARNDAEAALHDLRMQFELKREEVEQLSSRVDMLTQQSLSADATMEDLRSEVARQTEEKDNLRRKHQALSDELSAMVDELQGVNAGLVSRCADYDDHVSCLSEKVAELETSQSSLHSEKAAFEQRILQITKENSILDSSVTLLNAELRSCRVMFKDAEEYRQSLAAEVDRMAVAVASLRHEHEELKGNHASLISERDRIYGQVREVQDHLSAKAEEHKAAVQLNQQISEELRDAMAVLEITLTESQEKTAALLEHDCKLRRWMVQLLEVLNVGMNAADEDEDVLWQTVLCRVADVLKSKELAEDAVGLMSTESMIVTAVLMQKLNSDANDILVLQSVNNHLVESMEQLKERLEWSKWQESALAGELEAVKEAHLASKDEIFMLEEESTAMILAEKVMLDLMLECFRCVGEEAADKIQFLMSAIAERDQEIVGLRWAMETLQSEVDALAGTQLWLTTELRHARDDVQRYEDELIALVCEVIISAVNAAAHEERTLELTVEGECFRACVGGQVAFLVGEMAARDGCIEELMKKMALIERQHGQAMKDIELDQVASSSLYAHAGGGADGETGLDEQMLLLWEAAERDCRNVTGKSSASEHDIEAIDEVKEYTSERLSVIDGRRVRSARELELPRDRSIGGNVLGTIASESKRLSVMHAGVVEVKQKLDAVSSPNAEYGRVRARCLDTEAALLEQIAVNERLRVKAERCLSDPSNVQSDVGSLAAEELAEMARKQSDVVGRLELEVQKIQYVLLKLNDEHGKAAKELERRSRVLLRDYIYGRKDRNLVIVKKRRLPFCSCVGRNATA